MNDKRKITVDVPAYQGPDRRTADIVLSQCACHPKHERILKDHDSNIATLTKTIESRRVEVNSKMEKEKGSIKNDHKLMWDDIKAKVPNKLFYLFISVYSVLFIIGIVAVYTGMHKIDKSLTTQMGSINTEVKVVSTTLKYLDKKVDDHIYQTKNGNSKH